MPNRNGIKKKAINATETVARRPLSVFFSLFAAAVLAGAAIAYNYQRAYLADNPVPAAAAGAKNIFNPDKAKEYREIFTILGTREKEYGQGAPVVYPEVFKLPELPGPVVPKKSPEASASQAMPAAPASAEPALTNPAI